MHKLTMQAIAQAANVSCATVSRCLSGREGVGEKTRERVLRICRDMGYSPNFTDAAPHRSGRLGLVLPDLRNPENARLVSQLEEYLTALGYGLVLTQSEGKPEGEVLQRMEAQRVDGVILLPARRQSFPEIRLPLVYLNAHMGDMPQNYVAVDHFLGGQVAVRHLYSLGHKRIFYMPGGDPEISRKRKSGIDSACRQLKLEIPDKLEDATAVIAGDLAAAVALIGRVPVIGFGGDSLAALGLPLTTLDCPDNMAQIAVDILLEQLERPIGGYSHRMVVPQLKQRGSDTIEKEDRHG